MTLAKETERERDAPKAREAIYLLLDLVCSEVLISIVLFYYQKSLLVCSRVTVFNI